MKISKLLSIFLLFVSSYSFGQSILCGTISYRHLAGTTYEFDIRIYTTSNASNPLDSISLNLGDGVIKRVASVTNPPQVGIQEWVYLVTHTYNSSGQYTVSLTEGFRVAGIKNITNPASQAMHLEASVVVAPGQGANNSPVINNPPVVTGSAGAAYFHNQGAFDTEGDSLAYKLMAPSGNGTIPTGASIDQLTGNFQMPYSQGPYVVTIQVEEYRSGIKIGSSMQDLLVDGKGVIIGLDDQHHNQAELSVYPNPCAETLHLELETGLKALTLTSIGGKDVLSLDRLQSKSVETDISQLPAGVYLLEVTGSKGLKQNRKIIKK